MRDKGLQLIDSSDDGVVGDIKIIPVREGGKIISGLTFGLTKSQNISLILVSNPGDFKFNPNIGVGLENLVLGDGDDCLEYRHKIRDQFYFDKLKINTLDLYPNKPFKIDADYDTE